MIDSTRLRHEGDQAAGGTAELMVEPDAGRKGQDAGADARAKALRGAGAVALQAEQVLEGLEDRLDALADRPQARALPLGLVAPRRPDHASAQVGHRGGEVPPGIALVADDD